MDHLHHLTIVDQPSREGPGEGWRGRREREREREMTEIGKDVGRLSECWRDIQLYMH